MSEPPFGIVDVENAVRNIFNKWDALQMAIVGNWGEADDPVDVYEKCVIEDLMDNLTRRYQKHKKIQIHEIEEFLEEVLSEEFQAIADDDSIPVITNQIYQLFESVLNGTFVPEPLIPPPFAKTLGEGIVKKPTSGEIDEDEHATKPDIPREEHPAHRAERTVRLDPVFEGMDDEDDTINEMEPDEGSEWTVVTKSKKKK